MSSHRCIVVCCVLCLVSTGCRPVIQALSKIKVRPVPKGVTKPLTKPPARLVPPVSRPMSLAPAPLVRTISQRTPQIVAASKALGVSLQARRSQIPAHIYARLWSQWQRNDAELSSLDRQLAEDGLSTERRTRLESQVTTLEQKNAEIERLAAQWG